MKIDKRNFRHWIVLLFAISLVSIVIIVRRLFPRIKQKKVIFYGHKYNGNLKAFADYENTHKHYELYFLTQDLDYLKDLRKESEYQGKINYLSGLSLSDMMTVAKADVFICDRAPQVYLFLAKYTDIKFIDVWHGVPFKGYSESDFSFLKSYDEVWVSSDNMKKVYQDKFGIRDEKVYITGYARVDGFVNNTYSMEDLKRKYLAQSKYKHVILFAPTWQQDDKGRNIFPFKHTAESLFSLLNDVALKFDALVIFRSHINSKERKVFADMSNLITLPYDEHPLTEEILAITDVLITDWSSIAFDYLPLNRPTIFLDVDPPFKNGFTVPPEYRFGDVAQNSDQLIKAIETGLNEPKSYLTNHSDITYTTRKFVYGDTLDGQSAVRYHERLMGVNNERG